MSSWSSTHGFELRMTEFYISVSYILVLQGNVQTKCYKKQEPAYAIGVQIYLHLSPGAQIF